MAVSTQLLLESDRIVHPIDRLAVELFLNGDVHHGCGCCCAVPVLFTGWEPYHVTRPNFLDRASPALCPAAASCHDQGLTQRMRVPCGSSAMLKRDTGAACACRSLCLEKGINAH